MPIDPDLLADGDKSWGRGMDSSRRPSELERGHYSKGVNLLIPRSRGGLETRGGIHAQKIIWQTSPAAQKAYEEGPVQAEGWYWDGSKTILLRQAQGRVIKFTPVSGRFWVAESFEQRNSPDSTKAWFTRIPGGSILQDGVHPALLISSGSSRRARPDRGEITVGTFGAYVQNRYFYADVNRNFIQAGDYNSPFTIRESALDNVHGWLNPQDENAITAMGAQKQHYNTAKSGRLVWSDGINIYSTDVRGGRTTWERLDTNVGKVDEVIPGIGATSHYSFEPYNTDLYFRNARFGFCSLTQADRQFETQEDFIAHSAAVNEWLDRDAEWQLDQCYTVQFGPRLFTTMGATRDSRGFTYWKALFVFHPNPHLAPEGVRRRYEGAISGVRPWCLTVVDRGDRTERMFIDSRDDDGVTRLYEYVPSSNYDVSHRDEVIEIPSILETRGYDAGVSEEPKVCENRYYSLGELERDVNVSIYTRPEDYGQWLKQWDRIHLVAHRCANEGEPHRPAAVQRQERKRVNVDQEPEQDKGNPDAAAQTHTSRQWRFEFKGALRLYSWITAHRAQDWDKTTSSEETERQAYIYSPRRDFDYNIATANNNELLRENCRGADKGI